MAGQFLIAAVHHRIFTLLVADYTGLEVVADQESGDSAEVLEHMHMGVDPVLLLHGDACLSIAVHAEWQRRHEQIALAGLGRNPVIDVHSRASPVHHTFVAGLMLEVHGQAVLVNVIAVELAELGIHVGRLLRLTACAGVFFP